MKMTGIGADYDQPIEQGDKTEQERKRVRDALISAYDKDISTRLKAELCSSDVNNTTYTQDASTSKFLPLKLSMLSPLRNQHISFKYLPLPLNFISF